MKYINFFIENELQSITGMKYFIAQSFANFITSGRGKKETLNSELVLCKVAVVITGI